MGKIFATSEDIVELINQQFKKTSLHEYGVTLKIMSVTKAKEIIKISKASPATEFIANKDSMVQLFIYEAAFDRLTDDVKNLFIEMALSSISYDCDKDKLLIENNPLKLLFNICSKYGNDVVNQIEVGYHMINIIEEEEKEKKLMEKANKQNKNKEQW